MRNLFLQLIAVLVLVTSCSDNVKGSGDIKTKSYSVSESAYKVSISNVINLVLSDELAAGEMTIDADDNLYSYIDIADGTNSLSIGLESDKSYKNIDIVVTLPSSQYNDITLSGASNATIEGATAEFSNYYLDISGASVFSGDITAQSKLEMILSGASVVNLSGSTVYCLVECDGASDVNATDFSCTDLDINASGASFVTMEVNRSITGSLSGASKVRYTGSADEITVELSGSSTIGSL